MMMMITEPCGHGDTVDNVERVNSNDAVSTEDSSSSSSPLTGLLQIFSVNSEGNNQRGRSNKIQDSPTAIYNIPDGLESDPELIRGEMMFYNTPSTEKYAEHAYDTLINIQNQCTTDYDYYCGAQQFEPVSINDIMTNMFSSSPMLNTFFFNRRLTPTSSHQAPLTTGADYLRFIRSELSKRTSLVPSSPLSSLFFRSDLFPSPKKSSLDALPQWKDLKLGKITDHVGSNPASHVHSTIADQKKVSLAVMADENVRSTVQRRAAPGWVNPDEVVRKSTEDVTPAVVQRSLNSLDPESEVSQLKDDTNYEDSFNVFDVLYQEGDYGSTLNAKPISVNTLNAQFNYPWDERNVVNGAVSSSESSSDSSSSHGERHSFWGFGADKVHHHEEHGHDEDRHHDWHHHRRGPREEDTSFAGNLGFGADGDMCLYRNMDRLSTPCSSAISGLYKLREDYWREYQDHQYGPPSHPCLGLIVIAILVGVFFVRRYFGYKHRQQVRSLLTALHTHPDLKARVESETGVAVPIPYQGTCCYATAGSSTGTCPVRQIKIVLCRLLRAVLFFAFLLLSSLFITISSLELTYMVLQLIDAGASQDPVTGDLQLTSPFVALLILFSICAAQLSVLALIIRAVKRCMMNHHKRSPSPSAPCDDEGTNAGTPSIPSTSASNYVQYYFTSLPSALWGQPSSFRSSEVYVPLLSQEDKEDDATGRGAEMMALNPTVAQPQLSQYAMVVPLTARPVNSISMV